VNPAREFDFDPGLAECVERRACGAGSAAVFSADFYIRASLRRANRSAGRATEWQPSQLPETYSIRRRPGSN